MGTTTLLTLHIVRYEHLEALELIEKRNRRTRQHFEPRCLDDWTTRRTTVEHIGKRSVVQYLISTRLNSKRETLYRRVTLLMRPCTQAARLNDCLILRLRQYPLKDFTHCKKHRIYCSRSGRKAFPPSAASILSVSALSALPAFLVQTPKRLEPYWLNTCSSAARTVSSWTLPSTQSVMLFGSSSWSPR
jgi:hypothetical protein